MFSLATLKQDVKEINIIFLLTLEIDVGQQESMHIYFQSFKMFGIARLISL